MNVMPRRQEERDATGAIDLALALNRLVAFYEKLGPTDVARLDRFYAPDARFKDPFNDVQGIPAIAAVFDHMFKRLASPRFVVHESIQQGSQAVLVWDFLFAFRSSDGTLAVQQVIRGATHLQFDTSGLVCLHRDYWDAAEELYEKLPVLGSFMRWLRRRASR